MAVDNTARGLAGKALSAGATIADGSVTYAKIQNVSATDKLLGRSTAGAGVVEEIALTAAGRALIDDADESAQRTTLGLGTIATQAASSVAITGGSVTGITDLAVADGGTGASTFTDGGVLIGNGTAAVQVTTAGTSGQVLTSNGAGVDPTFQTLAAGGGSWIYLSTVTASASATVDIETTFNSTYDAYVIEAVSVVPATDAATLQVAVKLGGSYDTAGGNYYGHVATSKNNAATYTGIAIGGANTLQVTDALSSTSAWGGASFTMVVKGVASTTQKKYLSWFGSETNSSTQIGLLNGAGSSAKDNTALTGVRFLMSSGNIASGAFRLYGIKNS